LATAAHAQKFSLAFTWRTVLGLDAARSNCRKPSSLGALGFGPDTFTGTAATSPACQKYSAPKASPGWISYGRLGVSSFNSTIPRAAFR